VLLGKKPTSQRRLLVSITVAQTKEDAMQANKWTLMLLVLATIQADANSKDEKAACEKVKQQIQAIQTKMRNGYSASQGIRFEDRLRELRDKRYQLCR
jgi:hypothetical protein